ncbi:hypothetical protein [Pseudoteredinibacter isoporae]|uniref:hypothetical protein n=1 Tax=Pseudoteredinibacter isoporae TaxID=570281 RepID=UPI00310865F5
MIDLIEVLFKDVLRLLGLLVRMVIGLMYELCFETIGWYVGWPICRLFSLKRWPEQGINDQERASQLTQCLVSIVGLVSLLALSFLIASYTGEPRLN